MIHIKEVLIILPLFILLLIVPYFSYFKIVIFGKSGVTVLIWSKWKRYKYEELRYCYLTGSRQLILRDEYGQIKKTYEKNGKTVKEFVGVIPMVFTTEKIDVNKEKGIDNLSIRYAEKKKYVVDISFLKKNIETVFPKFKGEVFVTDYLFSEYKEDLLSLKSSYNLKIWVIKTDAFAAKTDTENIISIDEYLKKSSA
jgi:hypothetical protein